MLKLLSNVLFPLGLENQYFHLAHFNIAVATDEGEYPPCELAIVKFSLLDGIAGTIHEFVDPGKYNNLFSSINISLVLIWFLIKVCFSFFCVNR